MLFTPICCVGGSCFICYLYLFTFTGVQHDFHLTWCSCLLAITRRVSLVKQELSTLPSKKIKRSGEKKRLKSNNSRQNTTQKIFRKLLLKKRVIFYILLFVSAITRRVSLVKQELSTLPEHLITTPVFNVVHVAESLHEESSLDYVILY
jgi:hypothetical protein